MADPRIALATAAGISNYQDYSLEDLENIVRLMPASTLGVPTITPMANAGTGATITAIGSETTDYNGTFTLTGGTGGAAGPVVQVTFGIVRGTVPTPIACPGGNWQLTNGLFTSGLAKTGFTFNVVNAVTNGSTYVMRWVLR